jgi:hypothetical protein
MKMKSCLVFLVGVDAADGAFYHTHHDARWGQPRLPKRFYNSYGLAGSPATGKFERCRLANGRCPTRAKRSKSFLLLFFKKEVLP